MPLSAQTVAALFALCWALDVSGKHVKFNTSYTDSAGLPFPQEDKYSNCQENDNDRNQHFNKQIVRTRVI
eukprot:m.190792 g.190792  ORF g.190792 m.190792 type:complete len:70 (+) comp39437_c0_seq13:106-315(+)